MRRGQWLIEGLIASFVYLAAAAAMTWPAINHLDEVIIGGGELGGWLWRYWWHFTELEAIAASDLSFTDRVLTFLSLGRYPETGNILDVLFVSFPLSLFWELPAHYNLKVFFILVVDGLCGYALGRSLSRQPVTALAAGLLAVVNPLNLQDIHGSGLRQVVLWWVLLFPIALARAEERQRPIDGALAGLVLALCGAFYWFYGLFAGMFFGLWALRVLWGQRSSLRLIQRSLTWMIPLLITTAVIAGLFALPYILGESSGATSTSAGGGSLASKLPEVSFFLPFPEYDVIREVPLRPSTYEENVLSSLNRTIMSSWSVDYLYNPGHPRALSLAVLLLGVLPALGPTGRRSPVSRFWLTVFAVFFLGTLGPFLKVGAKADSSEVLLLGGEWVLRMPYTLMFQWVPGMARMFGPYRMGAMVVVASVALVALGLARAPGGLWGRRLLSGLAILGTVLQILYRWEIGPIAEGSFKPTMWRPPLKVSALFVPEWYTTLDPTEEAGIIELPLDQQQDLICFYQLTHRRKVFRSWATPPAIPPVFRKEGGGEAASRLRYLARPDRAGKTAQDVLLGLSRAPEETDLSLLNREELARLVAGGGYKHLVVHERGYYLVDPRSGPIFYRDVVRRLAEALQITPEEHVELAWFDYPGNEYKVPDGPVYVPWSSHEVSLPDQEMPNRYFMAVFDLTPLIELAATLPPSEEAAEAVPEDPGAHEHVEAAPGAPRKGAAPLDTPAPVGSNNDRPDAGAAP
jgi:hypothetical protein